LKWLNSAAIINKIAVERSVNKMAKHFFGKLEPLVKTCLTASMEQYGFYNSHDVVALSTDVKKAYADYFTKGNIDKASKELEKISDAYRKKDIEVINFCLGWSLALFFLQVVLIIMTPSEYLLETFKFQ
jgi:hypothetical protein